MLMMLYLRVDLREGKGVSECYAVQSEFSFSGKMPEDLLSDQLVLVDVISRDRQGYMVGV
jgi:hypothetical protein